MRCLVSLRLVWLRFVVGLPCVVTPHVAGSQLVRSRPGNYMLALRRSIQSCRVTYSCIKSSQALRNQMVALRRRAESSAVLSCRASSCLAVETIMLALSCFAALHGYSVLSNRALIVMRH